MQCYERLAMYLKLQADAIAVIPQIQFERNVLDEALSDFSIRNFDDLTALDSDRYGEMIKRIESVSASERLHEQPFTERHDWVKEILQDRVGSRKTRSGSDAGNIFILLTKLNSGAVTPPQDARAARTGSRTQH